MSEARRHALLTGRVQEAPHELRSANTPPCQVLNRVRMQQSKSGESRTPVDPLWARGPTGLALRRPQQRRERCPYPRRRPVTHRTNIGSPCPSSLGPRHSFVPSHRNLHRHKAHSPQLPSIRRTKIEGQFRSQHLTPNDMTTHGRQVLL